MAGPYYVDPAAAGSNNGSDWTNAWTSIQSAFDTAVAGEIVYCRGTQTYSSAATIDVDTNGGTNAGGYIKFIGCNSSGAVDGTRFILDVNSQAVHGVTFTDVSDMIWLENIEVANAGTSKHGITSTGGSRGIIFINCCAHNCGGSGFYSNGNFEYSTAFRCVSYSNTGNGFWGNGIRTVCCNAYSNGDKGFIAGGWSDLVQGSIAHANDTGISLYTFGSLAMNCAVDGNTSVGINVVAGTSVSPSILLANRITNHAGSGDYGLECNGEPVIYGYNYLEQGGSGTNINTSTDTLLYPILADATLGKPGAGTTDTNKSDQTDTNQGYAAAPTSHNFATGYTDATDPTTRRVGIVIPWTVGT